MSGVINKCKQKPKIQNFDNIYDIKIHQKIGNSFFAKKMQEIQKNFLKVPNFFFQFFADIF